MRCAEFVNADVNKFLRNIRLMDIARQRNQILTECTSHRRWKRRRKQTLREEATSTLAVFMQVLYTGRIGIWSVNFCRGRKTGEPGEKPSEQG